MDISIVIPTYNRKEILKKCLDSIFEQKYPRENFEVIVIDDSSGDGTRELLSNLSRKHDNVMYFMQQHKGPAAARNLGAKVSRGEIIAFIDDDCIAGTDWLKRMVYGHFQNPGITCIGGTTLTSDTKASVLVSQFLSTCSIETCLKGKQEVIFFPTCNVSLKRKIFEKYLFQENFLLPGGEDLEFFWRLFKEGHRFIWDRQMEVVHFRNKSLSAFVKQAHIYGRGNLLVQYIHRDHPLLKELKTGKLSFWLSSFVNFIKIPRFSFLLGKKLIEKHKMKEKYRKLSVYSLFILHKIFYISGNIVEFMRIKRENPNDRQKLPHIPNLIILDVTHRCNLGCRICDIWKTKETEKDIEGVYIKKLLWQAKELGIKEIALSGGEPLLRNDIFEIFEYARKIKIKDLGILTNGILIEKNINRLNSYLADNTISLVVSLDSLNQDLHNEIRNNNFAWEKTMGSLKALSLLKRENSQINFNLITIVLNQNLEELSRIAEFIKSLGANSLQFQPLLPSNLRMEERKFSNFWVSSERMPLLDEALDKLIYFKDKIPLFIKNSQRNLSLIKKYYRGQLTQNDIKCESAYKTILMSNQGRFTTCFSSYGDAKKEGLKKILQGRRICKAHKEVQACAWPCLLPCFCD